MAGLVNVGRTLRTPIHQDRGAGRRASALRAENALRRRRTARRRNDDRSRHVAVVAEKFRAPVADFVSVPAMGSPVAPAPPDFAAASLHYVVLYFAFAVTSVLAAALVHNHTQAGGQRAHPSLIAMTPQTISRAVTAPPRTALLDVPVQDVAALPAADPPPLAGLTALRENHPIPANRNRARYWVPDNRHSSNERRTVSSGAGHGRCHHLVLNLG